jgi:UDP-4-amino-4,6-dideoxy-N-acetyl-beta-L-altrosamine transaminase
MIPYGRQDIRESDIDSVIEILRSDFLTQGPAVGKFEALVASLVGAKHSVAVNSGTSALHIACVALGLGPGDLLWTTPNTFVASANCGRYCGATIDFVDIDAGTGNMDLEALRSALGDADRAGHLPKVVVPVHFAGQPTEQEQFRYLSDQYGFKILEDASHSIGASRNGEAVGSCRWSDISVFSFHPVKIVTSGEGGMALTNDSALAERMASFRTHGITRDSARFTFGTQPGITQAPPWYYEQHELGFNYRMTDIHAALGVSQVARLDEYVDRRNTLARRYDQLLADLPLELPFVLPENRSAFHLYVVRVNGMTGGGHRAVFEALRAHGIGVNVHYLPVHLQPYYRSLGFRPGQFPVAEAHATSAISLPLYATLTERQQNKVVQRVREELRD